MPQILFVATLPRHTCNRFLKETFVRQRTFSCESRCAAAWFKSEWHLSATTVSESKK
jgi:hypothetical protein